MKVGENGGITYYKVFVPMFGDLFLFVDGAGDVVKRQTGVFVPMFGDLFLWETWKELSTFPNCFRPHVWGSFFIACQRRPIPWGSAERFAAGIGHGIHGALSSGIAVPIFSGLMGIGGDLMKRLHQILKVLRVLRCAKCMLNSRHSCDNKRILEPSSP